MSDLQLSSKIESTPGVAGGQPRIAGTRFTVKQIAVWHEFMGLGADQIATEYNLSLADIYAALSYFFDHRAEIMQAIEAEEALVDQIKKRFPSKLAAAHA
ncbi:MAG: DUF433 domain-containing protein [Lewinellaceae bacterium]|nr:DUF433 domain-containing protein [Lewinellaceae bacterium]